MIKTKLFFIEFASLLLLMLFILTMYYFVFEKNNVLQDINTREKYHYTISLLHEKQNRLTEEQKNVSLLHDWEKNHSFFYQTISSATNINQQLSLLTQLIQQAHFTIQQISHTQALKNHPADCSVTVTATGNFINLFSLINTLIGYPFPFTLLNLLIDHQQFKMLFILRGCNA